MRAAEPAIPRGDLQHPEPHQLQHAEPDHLHAFRRNPDGGRDYQHLDHVAAGAVCGEAGLVENEVVLAISRRKPRALQSTNWEAQRLRMRLLREFELFGYIVCLVVAGIDR